jgi:hypothetical protein
VTRRVAPHAKLDQDYVPDTELTLSIVCRPGDKGRFPEVCVDGLAVPVGWGPNIICTTPGHHELRITESNFWEVGHICETIDVPPGETVELYYLAGATGWGPPRLSTTSMRQPGRWWSWLMYGCGAFALGAAAVGILTR